MCWWRPAGRLHWPLALQRRSALRAFLRRQVSWTTKRWMRFPGSRSSTTCPHSIQLVCPVSNTAMIRARHDHDSSLTASHVGHQSGPSYLDDPFTSRFENRYAASHEGHGHARRFASHAAHREGVSGMRVPHETHQSHDGDYHMAAGHGAGATTMRTKMIAQGMPPNWTMPCIKREAWKSTQAVMPAAIAGAIQAMRFTARAIMFSTRH